MTAQHRGLLVSAAELRPMHPKDLLPVPLVVKVQAFLTWSLVGKTAWKKAAKAAEAPVVVMLVASTKVARVAVALLAVLVRPWALRKAAKEA